MTSHPTSDTPRRTTALARSLLAIGPHRGAHRVALRAGVSVLVPLLVLVLLGHVEWTSYAAFGAFTSLYGRNHSRPSAPACRRSPALSSVAVDLSACSRPWRRTPGGSSCPWEPSRLAGSSPRTPTAGTRRARSSSSSASRCAPWSRPRRPPSRRGCHAALERSLLTARRPRRRPPAARLVVVVAAAGAPRATLPRRPAPRPAGDGPPLRHVSPSRRGGVATAARLAAPVLGRSPRSSSCRSRPASRLTRGIQRVVGTLLGARRGGGLLPWHPRASWRCCSSSCSRWSRSCSWAATTRSRCSSSPRWPCSWASWPTAAPIGPLLRDRLLETAWARWSGQALLVPFTGVPRGARPRSV